jgi:hypothetical protein
MILVDLGLEDSPDQECSYYIEPVIETWLVPDFSMDYINRNYTKLFE